MERKTKQGNRSPYEVEATLVNRDQTHGDYREVASLYCGLKRVIGDYLHKTGKQIPTDVQMSLDMILVKIARIVAGNPLFHDHWHDVEGYSRLISREVE